MPRTIWSAYPALRDALDSLAAERTWCLTGVSAVLFDGSDLLLEITKPGHWRRTPDGRLCVGLGAIGGSLEPGESVLGCLAREANEEIGTDLAVETAPSTFLVHEERDILRVDAPASPSYPQPALLTVSRNAHRRAEMPDCEVLAIVTFRAHTLGSACVRDLFGLLRFPSRAAEFLLAEPRTIRQVLAIPGARAETQGALPEDALLQPVWTARSLQVLHAAGRLTEVLPG